MRLRQSLAKTQKSSLQTATLFLEPLWEEVFSFTPGNTQVSCSPHVTAMGMGSVRANAHGFCRVLPFYPPIPSEKL
jgi:hypothetical protein